MVVQLIGFLMSANLICRSTDISKSLIESLGVRDNESRLYIFLTSGVKLHIHLLNVVVQFIVFLTLSTLICQGTDILKCFSESLGIRDNKSRLYMYKYFSVEKKMPYLEPGNWI